MTDKQKIAGLCFGLSLVLSLGFGWNYFLKSTDCNLMEHKISQNLDTQDNILFNYALFGEHSLTEDNRANFKRYMDLREPLTKFMLENYKDQCFLRKAQLIGFLKGYELYLMTKAGTFKESQASGFQWIRDTFPYDPVYSDIE